ncbi:unnamed protein product [Adineta steineri]|uniref:Homeobox domain-containing protein n=1 Tax=Adineta steineri TaxID=433720 RepID=A0A815P2H9_9BILA|nr:unnamed protein product [Adineta steineri]
MSSSQSRHVYNHEQRAILETSFIRQSYPDISEKERLAKLFNCNLIQISNWFQNRRRRVKKEQKIILQNTSPNQTSTYQQLENANEYSSYYEYVYPPSQYMYSSSYYLQQSYDQTTPFHTYYSI